MPPSPVWHSLYLKSTQSATIAAALGSSLEHLGYQRYDPFPGGAGTPPGLSQYVRLFVSRPKDGWVRVLGSPDSACLPGLSQFAPVLHLWLDKDASSIAAYYAGESVDQAMAHFLPTGRNLDELRQAEQGAAFVESAGNQGHPSKPPDGVPLDVAQLARDHNVNPAQAEQLINKITQQLFGKLDAQSGGEAGAMQPQAQALLAGHAADWNSISARRLIALARFLELPSNWRTPDFDDVREAYQVVRRLQRSPSARLMPDEQAAQALIPHALDYLPVYVGR